MKIYTRTGDDGTTSLQGGLRVHKSDRRIAAYGAVDELNASIGAAMTECAYEDMRSLLSRIQGELFGMGADLSEPDVQRPGRVTPEMVQRLEGEIDSYEEGLEPLRNFIMPGGAVLAASLHLARTVARRAEAATAGLLLSEEANAECMRYLNRLSDLLFVMARAANSRAGIRDTVWRP